MLKNVNILNILKCSFSYTIFNTIIFCLFAIEEKIWKEDRDAGVGSGRHKMGTEKIAMA